MSESFANKPPSNPDKDTFYTMGGLENLPTQEPAPVATAAPGFDLGQFIGSVEQLAQLYPGIQNRPEYDPGLSDIRYTRSFGGLGEPGSSFYSPSGAGNAPAPFQEQIVYQQPILQPQDQSAANEALLSGLLGMDWSGAYQDYLNKLQAQSQDINISNVFTPTNVNYQTQTQRQQQQQSMNGSGQSQEQDSQDDSQDDGFSLQDILKSINLGGDTDSDITDGALDSDFFTDTTTGGGNFNDTINLDDTFEGTDTTGGGNYVDTIVDTTKGTTKTDTLKGGNGNDFFNPDDTTIDFDIGRPDTVDGGTTVETIIGGDGNDSVVETGETSAEREARLAREQAERERLAREATVKQAYQAVLGRSDVDQEGLDYWVGQLESGKSSTDLLRDIVSGAQGADIQAAQNTDTVSKLYEDLLGRAPDAEGLSYYRSQLAAGASPEQVARNLISGAKAGSEASKISQEEYDRYFKQPEDTSTSTQNSVDSLVNSLNTQSLESLYSSMEDGRQATADIKDLATQYINGMILTPGITPQQLRDGFLTELAASRPDLLTRMVGDTIANQYTMEYYGGEGSTPTTGTDIRGLADEIVKRANDPDYVKAAIQLASILAGGGGTDSGAAGIGGQGAGLVALAESLINGDDAAKTFSNVATSIAVTAVLQATGPIGQTIYVLDSILAKEFGYDSPIQESVLAFAKLTEKGADWVIDKVSDIFGGVGDFVGDIGSFIGDLTGDFLAEGGLVDLPGDSMYNDNTQGVLPDIEGYARGGIIPLPGGGKIAKGPGGGLDDLIPTSIDGRRAAALSDGEFVIPADVVSMMGDGSTNAGSKRLYDLVRQVRQEKTGTSRQAGPLQVGKILERTMR